MKISSKSLPEVASRAILATLLLLAPVAAHATSLWDEEVAGGRTLFSDRKAVRKGDLVTIVVNLSTSATKDQSSKTSKTTTETDSLSALIGPFLGGVRTDAELARRNPHNSWNGSSAFEGKGKIAHTENFTDTIQARVADVLPGNVLRLEATRRVEVDQETSMFVLTGLIRREDLTPLNSVQSTQVADLQIKQVGQGAISRSQKKGWLTRAWETISPF
ncbi:MAG: flagellar basal body L-ring protein FlgH [Verrucomicrobiae bacterium]|nr:flagellar basal body L-ring protein FlgH [Verrucomicrobiae bacterium]